MILCTFSFEARSIHMFLHLRFVLLFLALYKYVCVLCDKLHCGHPAICSDFKLWHTEQVS